MAATAIMFSLSRFKKIMMEEKLIPEKKKKLAKAFVSCFHFL